jgi:hypothetical protein
LNVQIHQPILQTLICNIDNKENDRFNKFEIISRYNTFYANDYYLLLKEKLNEVIENTEYVSAIKKTR